LAVVLVLGLTTTAFASVATATTNTTILNARASDARGYQWAFIDMGDRSVLPRTGEHRVELGEIEHRINPAATQGSRIEGAELNGWLNASGVGLIGGNRVAIAFRPGSSGEWTLLSERLGSRWSVALNFSGPNTIWRDARLVNDTLGGALDGGDRIRTVQLRYVHELYRTNSLTVTNRIRITVDGRNMPDASIEVTAEMRNVRTGLFTYNDLERTDFEVELDGGANTARVLRVRDFIPRATILMDNDIVITSRLFDRDYYLFSHTNINAATQDVLDLYNFEDVVFLSTINLPDTARLSFDRSTRFWIYAMIDGNLSYLGRSNEPLPVINGAYYFSARELPLATTPVEPPIETGPPAAPPQTGPNTPPVNFNPGTGR
jgi:hypothetical protein